VQDAAAVRRSIWRGWGWLIAIAIVVGLVLPAVVMFPLIFVTPDADITLLGLIVVGWAMAQVVTLLGWLTRQYSGRAPAFMLLMAFGLILGLLPALAVSFAAKQIIARGLVTRSAPVIAAIEAFHQARGQWPDRIEALVPEFLPAVPTTGSALYPEYDLYTGFQAEEFGNPWVLVIPMYETLKFDALYYCPETDCGAAVRRIGGGTRRIGKWIFLDE
jgi:hypothetical protein